MHVNFLPTVVQQFAFNDPDITDDSITEKKYKKPEINKPNRERQRWNFNEV